LRSGFRRTRNRNARTNQKVMEDYDLITQRYVRRESGTYRKCPGIRGIVGNLPDLPFRDVPVDACVKQDLHVILPATRHGTCKIVIIITG
jgi:hypothetical protein